VYGIVYDDFLAHLINRMTALLGARTEPYAASVEVSNRKSSNRRRAVILTTSPGGGTSDTVRTSFVTLDVIADSEGDAVDLMNLSLALATSRGPGGMIDGQPVTHVEVNGGPNSDPAADGFFKQTAELELRHRGRNLI
jgi:hypothetical protein